MPQLRCFLLLSATRYNREMAMPWVIPKPRSGESGGRAMFSFPKEPHRGGPRSILCSLSILTIYLKLRTLNPVEDHVEPHTSVDVPIGLGIVAADTVDYGCPFWILARIDAVHEGDCLIGHQRISR